MTDLSPAAQVVLTAFGKHPLQGDHIAETLMHGALPAALRAAADQVVPDEPEPEWWEPVRPRFNRQCIRRRLLAIAAELEGDGPAVAGASEPIDANPR